MTAKSYPLHETITVQRSAADCYAYLADFSTIEQWDPGVYRAEKLSAGAPRLGSEFALQLSFLGRRTPMTYRITALQSDALIELQGEGDGYSAHDRIQFTHLGAEQTRIDYQATISVDAPPPGASLLLPALMRRMGRKAVQGMAAALQPPQHLPQTSLATHIADRLILPAALNFTERGYLQMQNKGLSEFMDGQRVVITGPTGGLGLAAAQMLSRLRADLVLVGRKRDKLEQARQVICDYSGADPASIDIVEADLLSMSQVRKVADTIGQRYSRIDVLINNAGALFNRRGETGDGHEQSLAINLIAPWLLTEGLMPTLRASRARVIGVASGGLYTQPLKLGDLQFKQEKYDGPKAYARAKRGLVAVTEHWAASVPEVRFNSMHPGWAATPGVEKSLPAFNKKMEGRLRDSRMGADSIVWLASAAAAAQATGQFWFDRQAHATAVVPGTAHGDEQREQLLEWLRDL